MRKTLLELQAMSETPEAPSRLHHQPWFLCLLGLYAVLELSFNHRLLDWAAGALPGVQVERLHEMEIWARIVSGLGLALLLMRWLDRVIRTRWLLVLLSMALGVTCIWHLQKTVVQLIVERADAEDKMMSVQAMLSTQEALKGRVALRGLTVLEGPAPTAMRPVMGALWASTVQGLVPQDLEYSAGAAQLTASWARVQPSESQLRDAYRRVVIVPVALGSSLLFGMLNICQFFAGLSAWLIGRWGSPGLLTASRRFLLASWVGLCVFWSLWPGNDWVDSAAYQQVAQPALWQTQPLLAPFVEWSLRAELAWSDPVAWVHRQLLGDFDFRLPPGLLKLLTP